MTTDTINPLVTSRYSGFQPWMGVPIRTSTGSPRWMPGLDYLKSVAPIGVFGRYNTEFEFRLHYTALLDRHADQIHTDLLRLSDRHPDQTLVLLCYCDVLGKGDWCHRRMLADWLADRDVQAPELNPRDAPLGSLAVKSSRSSRRPADQPYTDRYGRERPAGYQPGDDSRYFDPRGEPLF